MSKKDLLAKALSKLRLLPLAIKAHGYFTNSITILAYHRIYDMGDEKTFPFDPELISATTAEFKLQMQYVKKHFNPVTFNDLIEFQNGNKALPKRPIIITFDDGHLDNYTQAYPILDSLSIPATIFLSTNYIGSNKIFWFDWVAYCIYRTTEKSLSINNNDFEIAIGSDVSTRRSNATQLLIYLMSIDNESRLMCIEEINQKLKVCLLNEDKEKSAVLNWEQVTEMLDNNIEFGSHTVSHPILSKLNIESLKAELSESKKEIESKLNINVDIIAYPAGGKNQFNNSVIDECKKAGYKLGISYISGTESIIHYNSFLIKRLHVERYTNLDFFKSMLAFPSIFK